MYLDRMWIYGNRIEHRKYHTSRYGVKGETRKSRSKPTAESIAKNNEKAAERRLFRLLVANFTEDDHFLTLTYRKDDRPDVEGSKKIMRRFFEGLRKAYKKAGVDLKYVITTEWNKKTIHHHIVINDIPGFEKLVRSLWIHGNYNSRLLYSGQDYQGLAEYLVKETKETFRDKDNPYRQRYSCSRNLTKPVEKVKEIRANSWREIPSVSPALAKAGYQLDVDTINAGVDVFGYPYLEYTFIRRETRKKGST